MGWLPPPDQGRTRCTCSLVHVVSWFGSCLIWLRIFQISYMLFDGDSYFVCCVPCNVICVRTSMCFAVSCRSILSKLAVAVRPCPTMFLSLGSIIRGRDKLVCIYIY